MGWRWGEGYLHESWSRCMGNVSLCYRPEANVFGQNNATNTIVGQVVILLGGATRDKRCFAEL